MTVIIFLIVLAILIFVHEFGHFIAARASGIRVDEFKLGFGPKIIRWKRGETEYGINLIPFGGFVKIHGEDPDEESAAGSDAHRSFINKPRWKQAIVLLAGIFFNFLFAWLLYTGAFVSGVTATTDGFEKYAADFHDPRIMITYVEPGSPADKAGIQLGDVIIGVTSPASVDSSDQSGQAAFSSAVPSPGEPLTVDALQTAIDARGSHPLELSYSRGSDTETAEITPVTGLVPDKYAIGIAMSPVVDLRLPFFPAVWEGFKYTLTIIQETAVGLASFIGSIFHGTADFSSISGPVGIAGIVGNAAQLGFNYLVMITALISINLGVINLIPFPALDGGRVLFVLIEGISRRRIPARFTNIVNTVGFALLMILMVFVTYRDILKLVK